MFCGTVKKKEEEEEKSKKHLTRFSCSVAFLFFGGQQVNKSRIDHMVFYMFAISSDF